MTDDFTAPGRKYDIGKVLGNAFKVVRDRPLLFLVLTIVITGAPLVLVGGASLLASAVDDSGALGASGWLYVIGALLGFLLVFLPYVWLQATLILATVDTLDGTMSPPGEIIQRGFRRLFPFLGVAIVFSIVVGFGFVLLIVPGVIFAVVLSAAAPEIVSRRPGVFGAFTVSRNLTRGSRWGIFLVFLVIYLITFAVGIVLGLVMAIVGGAAGLVAQFLSNAVSVLLVSTAAGASYVELRDLKEGPQLDELTTIFE